jgi:hypothetical protein
MEGGGRAIRRSLELERSETEGSGLRLREVICQCQQLPRASEYKLVGVKRSKQPVENLSVIRTCDSRSHRRAEPGAGAVVVVNRRAGRALFGPRASVNTRRARIGSQ